MMMDKLPRLSSGKLDLKPLLQPKTEDGSTARQKPVTEHEQLLHNIWVDFAKMLNIDRPIYGIQGNEYTGNKERHSTIEDLAEDYADQIIEKHPNGPYHLVGYSLGGIHAFAVAKCLQDRGKKVRQLYIIDTQPRNPPPIIDCRMILPYLAKRALTYSKNLIMKPGNYNLKFILSRWGALKDRLTTRSQPCISSETKPGVDPGDYYHVMSKNHLPIPTDLEVSLFVAKHTSANLKRTWQFLTNDQVRSYKVKGEHMDILNTENLESFVEEFEQAFIEFFRKELSQGFSFSAMANKLLGPLMLNKLSN